MLAAFVSAPAPKDPLSVLEVGDRPEPEAPEGWTTVDVKAVSLNHHDLFSLQGIGLPKERMPMILGTDAAGLDQDGNEVVVHAVVALGSAAGYRMWVTGRSEEKRTAALALGADQAFETGARLPGRVDGVMETVGDATWSHSVKSLKPGGVIVTSGATTGYNPGAELNRVFFTQLSVIGSTMGTREELEALMRMCASTGVRPVIDVELPLTQAREGFERMLEGRTAGKI